jgi:hypothetical protein
VDIYIIYEKKTRRECPWRLAKIFAKIEWKDTSKNHLHLPSYLMMECLHQESSKKKKKKSRAAYPQGDWAIPGARAIEAF